MPRFDVILNGTGIDLPSLEESIIGFHATRRVKANDAREAGDSAKRMVQIEWRDGNYQPRNRAAAPVVEVEGVIPLSWWKRLTTKQPKEGLTFYTMQG